MNRDHLHSASHQSSAHNHPRTDSRAPLNPSNDGADPSASSSAHRQSPSNDIASPPLSSLSSTQQLISGAIQFQTLANHQPPSWASISQGGAQPSTFPLNGIGSHNPIVITQTLSHCRVPHQQETRSQSPLPASGYNAGPLLDTIQGKTTSFATGPHINPHPPTDQVFSHFQDMLNRNFDIHEFLNFCDLIFARNSGGLYGVAAPQVTFVIRSHK